MATLEITIGHDVESNIPYKTNNAQPKELIILSFRTFFIINEINRTTIAAYPTHSVILELNISITITLYFSYDLLL